MTDKPACGGVALANEWRIPTLMFPPPKDPSASAAAAPAARVAPDASALAAALRDDFRVDFVLLAGYLKLVPEALCRAFPRAIFNIHPALLPAFGGKGYYGMNVHRAVVAAGARVSGPTVHVVDESYDRGPIIVSPPPACSLDPQPEGLFSRPRDSRFFTPRAGPSPCPRFPLGHPGGRGAPRPGAGGCPLAIPPSRFSAATLSRRSRLLTSPTARPPPWGCFAGARALPARGVGPLRREGELEGRWGAAAGRGGAPGTVGRHRCSRGPQGRAG